MVGGRDVLFFNDTPTSEIYTLSLHDALPISGLAGAAIGQDRLALRPLVERIGREAVAPRPAGQRVLRAVRSEEHTSELQSRQYLVCRLLLEKKKYTNGHCCLHTN